MRHYYTYFDKNYLSRGLALYFSLKKHAGNFVLFVLCLDDACHEILSQKSFSDMRLIRLAELENEFPELLKAKADRSTVEYYFTLSPCLPLYLERRFPEYDILTYLDSDLFFFSDPSPVHEEMGNRSVAIIEHRFPSRLEHLKAYGIYNVGWISFRRDENARDCLEWWKARCLEWCKIKIENGLYADQKYLDEWPSKFKHVAVLKHEGANVAPWNLSNTSVTVSDGKLQVNGKPLVFFHFHGLSEIKPWLFDTNLERYGTKFSPTVLSKIYRPYIKALLETRHDIGVHAFSGSKPGIVVRADATICWKNLALVGAIVVKILKGQYVFAPGFGKIP